MPQEDALDNLADYSNMVNLKFIFGNILSLRKLAESGNQTALCIVMDLESALNSNVLTQKQRQVVIMKFIGKETNDYIAQQMNVSETAIRKHIQGAMKRVQRFLLK